MKIEIKAPAIGESIKEAILVEWLKKDGEMVSMGEPLFLLETDKITLEVTAEADGVLRIMAQEGETIEIGATLGELKTVTDAPPPPPPGKPKEELPNQEKHEASALKDPAPPTRPESSETVFSLSLSPSVAKLAERNNVNIKQVIPTGPAGRITKGDILTYLESLGVVPDEQDKLPKTPPEQPPVSPARPVSEEITIRKSLSPIRRRIAERLLEAKHKTAMLTTFNEIDMSQIISMRQRYKALFEQNNQIGLGFMSFFVKASTLALKEIPAINAYIDGTDIIFHEYYHISVAIGSAKGLVVPVIKHTDKMSFAEIERAIVDYVTKIKENKLYITDMEGGTFTITNGGIFGSLLSTPILNPPQSAILGMHKIEKRPVVVDDEIVIRPMMYVALSYDHRIVDGKQAVTFLKRIKECVENPERIMIEV